MLTKQQKDLVAKVRASNPNYGRLYTQDEDYYQHLVDAYPEKNLPPIGKAPQAPRADNRPETMDHRKWTDNEDTWTSWATSLLLPDEWVKKSDILKKATINSTGGALHEAVYGKSKFKLPENEPEDSPWYNEWAQALVGMANPVDIALFGASMASGWFAAARGAALVARFGSSTAKSAIRKFGATDLGKRMMAEGAGAVGYLTTHMGATGAIRSAADQKMKRNKYEGGTGEINPVDVIKDTSVNVAKAVPLAAATGAIAGSMGNIHAKLFNNNVKGFSKGTQKILTSHPARAVAEGFAFTTMPYLWGEGPRSFSEFNKALAMDVAMYGVFNSPNIIKGHKADIDLLKNINDQITTVKAKDEIQVLKSVAKATEESSGTKLNQSFYDEINKKESLSLAEKYEFEDLEAIIAKSEELAIKNEKGTLTDAERLEYMEYNAIREHLMHEVYDGILTSDASFKSHIDDINELRTKQKKDFLTEKEIAEIKDRYTNNLEVLKETIDSRNKLVEFNNKTQDEVETPRQRQDEIQNKKDDDLVTKTDAERIQEFKQKFPKYNDEWLLNNAWALLDAKGNLILTQRGKQQIDLEIEKLNAGSVTLKAKDGSKLINEARDTKLSKKKFSQEAGADTPIRNIVYDFINKRIGKYKPKNTDETVEIGSNNILPNQENDIVSYLATMGTVAGTQLKALRTISDFLDKQGIKTYGQITPKKVVKYIEYLEGKFEDQLSIPSKALQDINQFHDFLVSTGKMKSVLGDDVRRQKLIADKQQNILTSGDDISSTRQEIIDEINLSQQVRNIVKKFNIKGTLKELGSFITGKLHTTTGLGMRTQEVNKLTPSSFTIQKGTDGSPRYMMHLKTGVAKEFPRKIEIGKEVYDAIQDLIVKKKLSSKDKSTKFLAGQGFIENIISKVKYPKDYSISKRLDDVRKSERTRFVTGDLQLLKDFEPTVNYFFGHELSSATGTGVSAKYTKGLSQPKKLDISRVLRKLLEGEMNPKDGLKLLKKLTSRDFAGLKKGEIDSKLKGSNKAKVRGFGVGEGDNILTTKDTLGKLQSFLQEKFPDVTLRITNNAETWKEIARKVGINNPDKVLGAYVNNAIYVRKGDINVDVIPHEILHYTFDVIRSMGSKFSKDLLKRAESVFKPDAEAYYKSKGRLKPGDKLSQVQLEEFIVQRMQRVLTNRITDTSMVSKVKSYVKYLNAKLVSFFGLDKLSKGQLDTLITESAFRRQDVPMRTVQPSAAGLRSDRQRILLMTQEKTKGLRENINSRLDETYKALKLDASGQKFFVEAIAKQANIQDPANFAKNFNTATEVELNDFFKQLKKTNVAGLPKNVDVKKWFETYDTVKQESLKSNLNKLERDSLLFNLGVKDGNIFNASIEQLETYLNIIGKNQKKTITVTDWIQDLENQDLIGKKAFSKFQQLTESGKALTMPIDIVVKEFSPKLANKLRSHVARELKALGKSVIYEYQLRRDLKSAGYSQRKGRDLINLLDKDRTARRIRATEDPNYKEADPLTKQEQKFLKNAVDENYNVKGKYKTVNGRKVWEGPLEAKMAQDYKNLMKDYKQTFLYSVKVRMNKAEYENFLEENNINWIDDGNNFYVHRKLTNEFKRYYDVYGRHTSEMVEAEAKKIATKKAKGNKPTEKDMAEAMEEANSKLVDMFEFNTKKFSPGFLQSRHVLLPEKIYSEKLGKTIQVYENRFDNSVKAYATGMSKLIANVEYFPEVVKLKGLTKPGYKADIGSLISKGLDRKWADYIKNAVERHVGIPTEAESFLQPIYNTGNAYATLLAKLQLSFPTSGVKNLFLGNVGTTFAFGVTKLLRGSYKIFDKGAMDAVRKGGHTEIGLREIEEPINIFGYDLNEALDVPFGFGLMKATEDINRLVAVHAGKLQFAEDVDAIRGRNINMTDAQYKQTQDAANLRMKDFWFLTDPEIAHLKKYGKSIEGYDFATDLERMQARHMDDIITQKVDTFSHINTQGASVDIFMPNWFAHKGLRPLTLYKRMAYAASTNTLRNSKLAIQAGNWTRPLIGLGATYGTGYALLGMFDALMGTSPPAETDKAWQRFFVPLWRGEFMGILSEFFQIPFGEMQVGQWAQPAMYSNATTLASSIYGYANGYKSLEQAYTEYQNATVGMANAINKMYTRAPNRYGKAFYKTRKALKNYREEYGEKASVSDTYKQTTRSPYYKDLKETFIKGDMEEFMRLYTVTELAVASDLYNDKTKFKTLNGAFKSASGIMKRKLSSFNPLGMTDEMQAGEYKNKALGFLKFIKSRNQKVFNETAYAMRVYDARVKEFKAKYPAYLRSQNLKDMAKDFEFKKN